MPITIYLDSNDFSDLSRVAEEMRPEDKDILSTLRSTKANATALFVLSPPLLSEAVHSTLDNKQNALRRASLMKELCGDQLLRYPTDICAMEVEQALSSNPRSLTLQDILSDPDEWFGTKLDPASLPESRIGIERKIQEMLKLLPRKERRKWRSQLNFNKARSKQLIRQLIKDGRPSQPDNDPLLHLIDEELFVDWFVKDKTDDDVRRHLQKIISDPYVLFAHVIDRIDQREALYALTRSGGAKLSKSLQTFGQHLATLHNIATSGGDINPRRIAETALSSEILRDLVVGLASKSLSHLDDQEVLELIDKCPSISTLVHALRQYVYTLVQSNFARFRMGNMTPIVVNKSDFGDLMHLFYAPYVDIFRCDARFGERLKNHSVVRSKIVARRKDILTKLNEASVTRMERSEIRGLP